MTDERLIEEAAKAIEKVPYHAWHDVTREGARELARTALAVFEKAHAPTDDERVLSTVIEDAIERWGDEYPTPQVATYVSAAVRAAGFRRSEVPEPSAARPSPPVYLAADLWQALGAPISEFDAYYERNGWADTWSNLLGAVRDRFRPKCGQSTEGEPCILTAGHLPPHYGSSDVGSHEPVPIPEPHPLDALEDGTPSTRRAIADAKIRERLNSKPQGEPSDAQVRAAAESLAHSAGYIPEPMVRAALRAAGATHD